MTISRREGSEATKTNVITALRDLVKGARAGDVLLFAYMGHGTMDNTSGSERHCVKLWKDEERTGQVLLYDDEIAAILSPLHPDVNITCIFHACLSGGLVDDVPSLTSRANRGIAITANDRETPAYMDNGLIQGLSEEIRQFASFRGDKVNMPPYGSVFASVRSYIQNHYHTAKYEQNPQLVNMTGNDGGKRQDLTVLPYLSPLS